MSVETIAGEEKNIKRCQKEISATDASEQPAMIVGGVLDE